MNILKSPFNIGTMFHFFIYYIIIIYYISKSEITVWHISTYTYSAQEDRFACVSQENALETESVTLQKWQLMIRPGGPTYWFNTVIRSGFIIKGYEILPFSPYLCFFTSLFHSTLGGWHGNKDHTICLLPDLGLPNIQYYDHTTLCRL